MSGYVFLSISIRVIAFRSDDFQHSASYIKIFQISATNVAIMPILETALYGGSAFVFGWLFGNSPYGQVNRASRLKKEDILQLLIPKEVNDSKVYGHTQDKLSTPDKSLVEIRRPMTTENALLSFKRYRQAATIRPTNQEDVQKLAIADEFRERAATHALSSREYFADSRKSSKNKSKEAANLLIARGTKEENFMEECNVAAAAIYFRHYNPNYRNNSSLGYINLSRLQQKEVLRYVETIMQKELTLLASNKIVSAVKKKEIIFFIDTENDDKWIIRKILLTIEKYLIVIYSCNCVVDSPDIGCLLVRFDTQTRVRPQTPVKKTPTKENYRNSIYNKMPPALNDYSPEKIRINPVIINEVNINEVL